MLVDRGLLTPEELDEVLALQKESGRKLGEIIVECGFISGPTLALTLAEQWGVELTADEGFGTGLRNEIQKRHEGERKRRPDLHAVEEPALKGHEIFEQDDHGALAELNAQLAEDDERIVHLEAGLLERDDRIAKLENEAREREARISDQIGAELSRLEERFSETQKDLLAAAADWRTKHETQIVKLLADKLGRLEAGVKEARQVELGTDDRDELGRGIAELVTKEHAETRKQLVAAAEKQRTDDAAHLTKLLADKLRPLEAALENVQARGLDADARAGLEERIAELVKLQLTQARRELLEESAKQRQGEGARLAKLIEDKLDALELPEWDEQAVAKLLAEKLRPLEAAIEKTQAAGFDADARAGLEGRIAELMSRRFTEARRELLDAAAKQRQSEETRLAKLLEDKLDVFEFPAPVQQTVEKPSATNEELMAKVDQLQSELQSLARPGKRDELAGLGADLRTTVKRLDRIEELVRTSTREIFERLEATPVQAPAEPEPIELEVEEPEPVFSEHLVFAPSESGYALVTVELPPPKVGAEIALGGDDDERFIVTKVASSPFPRDERPCAYLQRVT
jgi:hypothetical protein